MDHDNTIQKFKIVIGEIDGIKYTIFNSSLSLRETPARRTITVYRPPSKYQKQKLVIISDSHASCRSPLNVNLYSRSFIIFSGICDNAYMFIHKAGKETYNILQESGQLTKNCITFGNKYPWVSEILECNPSI